MLRSERMANMPDDLKRLIEKRATESAKRVLSGQKMQRKLKGGMKLGSYDVGLYWAECFIDALSELK